MRLSLKSEHGWGALAGGTSYAGRHVSMMSAMQHSTVWACIRQTAQTIASLPAALYMKEDDSRVELDERVAEVLTVSPNSDQTGLEYWEGQVAWILANGNCYAERHERGGRLVALEPLPALATEPVLGPDGRKSFIYNDRGRRETLPANKVFHVKGFGTGGLKGLSAIKFGVHSMGAALAADETAARTFGAGMMPSGFLSVDGELTDIQRSELQGHLQQFVGSKNAGKTMVLEAGMQWDGAQLNPEDAQMLETRRYSVEDICRWFGTPPIVVGHGAEGQTMYGTGVESIFLAWRSLGLNPLLRRFEARIKTDFLRARKGVYFEWNREGLLQMDTKAKGEFLRSMVNAGIMTLNEARAKLNLGPVEGGDVPLVQGAMIGLDELLEQINERGNS